MNTKYLSKGNGAQIKIRVPDSFYNKINNGQKFLEQTTNKKPSKGRVIHYLERGIDAQGFETFNKLLITGVNNRKPKTNTGNIMNILLIACLLLVVTVGIYLSDTLLNTLNDNKDNMNLGTYANDTINKITPKFASVWDNMYLLLFLGLAVMAVVGGSIVQSNKTLLFISILGFALMLVLTSFISSATQQFQLLAGGDDNNFTDRYPTMSWINDNMVLVSLIYGALLLLGMFMSTSIGGD